MKKMSSMTSPKGIYSSKTNPVKAPKMTKSEIGPSSNPDAQKANRLLKKAYMENDSLRGKSGM